MLKRIKLILVVISLLSLVMILIPACQSAEKAEEEVVAEEVVAEEVVIEEGETIMPDIEYDWEPVEIEKWVDTTKYIKDPPYTIGLVTGWIGESWMDIYVAEIKDEVNMYGDSIEELIHLDAAADIPTQIANIEDLIARGVDAIIIDPLSPTALVPVIEKAFDAGIVTVVSKNGIDTKNYTAFINGDSVQFGSQSAQWLVDQMGGKGKILALRGVPGYGVDIERWAGAESVFNRYPDLEIVFEYGHWSYDKAKEVSKSLVTANPEFDGIWTMGGQMHSAFIDTLLETGYDPADYYHGSEDENGYCLTALDLGMETFASSFPVWQGRLCIRVIMDAFRGIPVVHTLMLPCPGYTPEDIENLANPDLPDKAWLSTTLSDEELIQLLD